MDIGFDGFNGTFNTTRFFSEDELEDIFPEVDDDSFPEIEEVELDDAVRVGVNLQILDDDDGIGEGALQFLGFCCLYDEL